MVILTNNILENSNGDRPPVDLVADGSRTGSEMSAGTQGPQGPTTIDLLQDVIDASAANIVILDESRTILYVNRAWRHFATRTGSLIDQFGIGAKYPGIGLGTIATSLADAKANAKYMTDGGYPWKYPSPFAEAA